MASKSADSTFFLVTYRDPKDGSSIEVKVKKIEDSSLGLSFVKLSEFIFETGSAIVQPTEEQLKKRFENVKSLHLNVYSILAIEELGMNHIGLKFRKDKSNLLSFPSDLNPR